MLLLIIHAWYGYRFPKRGYMHKYTDIIYINAKQ